MQIITNKAQTTGHDIPETTHRNQLNQLKDSKYIQYTTAVVAVVVILILDLTYYNCLAKNIINSLATHVLSCLVNVLHPKHVYYWFTPLTLGC